MSGTIFQVLGLVIGFFLLIKGANIFVDASVNIAKKLNVPSIVIGLTIVAIGTSAPEAVISVSAAIAGANSMAIGNAIGSNLFNLMLAVGLCAVIRPIAIRLKEISRDYWVSVVAAVFLLVMKFIFNDTIPRLGALLLLCAFVVYMVVLVRQALKNKVSEAGEANAASMAGTASVANASNTASTASTASVEYTNADKAAAKPLVKPLPKSVLFAVLGAVIIVTGGQVTVNNAVSIALTLGITERVVGLTILAIGTSLPELVTTLVACKKGENDMAIGNIVGSNIFNLLFVLGISGVISPLIVDNNLLLDLGVLIVASFAFFLFAYTSRRIVRFEGLSLVTMYALYMFVVIFL